MRVRDEGVRRPSGRTFAGRRLGLALAAAGLLGLTLTFGVVVAAAPASAMNTSRTVNTIPNSGTKCMDGSGIIGDECTYINGSGSIINYMQGVFYNGGYITEYNIHVELAWPSGVLIKNCNQVNVLAGTRTPVCQWSPHLSEPFGYYCSYAWKELATNNYKMVAKACVDVYD
jgi:hypothetical protein